MGLKLAEKNAMKSDEIQSLNVEELLALRRQIEEVLSSRREQLERQIRMIGGEAQSAKAGSVKIPPRYRSRKDPSLKWSGRGALPRWMREEMKGTKLTKHDFLIARK
jgi:DNA-binding protein H-NS